MLANNFTNEERKKIKKTRNEDKNNQLKKLKFYSTHKIKTFKIKLMIIVTYYTVAIKILWELK